ncbi:MAG: hypothetical protein ABIP38_00390 [Steroidobacteraceae bacterium]
MQHKTWRGIAATVAGLACGVALAATPDLGGTWLPVEALSTPWPEPLPLTDAAQARFGAFDPDRDEPTGFCMPLGTPRNTLAGASPMEVLQTPDRVYFIFQPNLLNVETRRVYLNVPAKPADPDRLPTWLGTSRGHFEGDALIVETTEMEPQAILHGSGLTHSGQLRLRERWHLGTDAKRGRILIDDLVLDDPASFREPVRLRRVFAYATDAQFAEGQCSERLWIDQLWRHRLTEHAAARKAAAPATAGAK